MKKGYMFIILTAFFYSTQEISGKFLAKNGHMDPFQVMFIVFLIGAVLLFPAAVRDIKVKKIKITGKDITYFAVCGILSATISMSMLQFAVTYTKASTAAVIFCTNAVFTVPFAYFILKEKINKATILSMIISLIGVIVIFNPAELMSGFSSGKDILGILLALLAAVTWSLYTVLSKKRISSYGGYVFNFFAFCFGVITLFGILIFTGRPVFSGINFSNFLILLYMGIFIKALGYVFYLGAVRETSAVTASTVFLIKPALASILSVAILGESIESSMVIGILFIIGGSYINFLSNKKQEIVSNINTNNS